MKLKKPAKPSTDKTGVYVDDYGERLQIFLDDTPKSIGAAIDYLEKRLKYKEEG